MSPRGVHPFLREILRGSDPEMLFPLAPEDRDWREIIRDATAQRFTFLLYRRLKQSDTDGRLPACLMERLEGEVFRLAARNLMLASELKGILQAFEERQLPCAPLRGLALAERLYGDITTRPMGDLDLLVRKADLPEVASILRGLGFSEMDRRPGFAQAFYYTLKFFKERHGWIIVEPHWTLAYPPFVDRIDMEGVWERCVRGRVVGIETWLLAPEDLLLHLCLHLTHHDAAAPLLWLYELDRLVREERETLDWSRVVSLAREATLGVFLVRALRAAQAQLATPVPAPIFDQLTQAPLRSVEGRLVRLLEASGIDGKESLALFFALKGFRSKLSYALALLFPSPEFMRLQYGLSRPSQLLLAYLRRFCRLSWESAKGVAKLLS